MDETIQEPSYTLTITTTDPHRWRLVDATSGIVWRWNVDSGAWDMAGFAMQVGGSSIGEIVGPN